MYSSKTFYDAIQIENDGHILDEAIDIYIDAYDNYLGEQEAESAWLRHAESLGWEDALDESYIESGLKSRRNY